MIYDLQKASMWKRISAFLFDAILIATVAVAVAWALSAIFGYDAYNAAYNVRKEEHKTAIEAEYADDGIDFDISEEEKAKLTNEQKVVYQAAEKALVERYTKDQVLISIYNMMINLSLVIVGLSLFVAFLILEFAVPLFLRNGRTLGKKIFGIAVMQTNGTRIKHVTVFVRSILGKYTVGTMIPVYCILPFAFGAGDLLGLIVAAIILVVQVAMVFATRTNSPIHDGLSSTVVVDFATQMIFETEEELLEYKKKAAAKIAEERKY